jgi:hypothetical protein
MRKGTLLGAARKGGDRGAKLVMGMMTIGSPYDLLATAEHAGHVVDRDAAL